MDPEDTMEAEIASLLPTFVAESEEGLAGMEEALMVLENRPRDEEALGDAFRVAHTIKGNAAMMRLPGIEHLAHATEELLDRMREGALRVTGDLVTLLLRAVDALRRMISEAQVRRETSPAARSMIAELARATPGEATEEVPDTTAAEGEPIPDSGPGVVDQPPAETVACSADSLRVDLDKLDRLLDLTGELGIARLRLEQLLEDPEQTRAAARETLEEADFLHLDFQELVMKLRMVPVGSTFRRYRRTVRDLARTQGKRARLVIEGEEVEVDATVIEHLRDPLNHMVRNALDHGIELPEERAAAGKDPRGLVELRARQEAGTIVIELSDDGGGLDRERILERARSAGIVLDEGEPSEAEIEKLIFEPGFTTSRRASSRTGRGLGMDVVRRNIEALRGSVAVRSQTGEGATITLRLPLTLAILDGLTVGVAGETFFLPLEMVVESVELPPEERRRKGRHGALDLRGETLPYVRLRRLFRLEGPIPLRENVLVVESRRGRRAGLVVDALYGQSQAVIQPLAKLLRKLPGISGSTILGNGRVAFILDVPGLLRGAVTAQSAGTPAGAAAS